MNACQAHADVSARGPNLERDVLSIFNLRRAPAPPPLNCLPRRERAANLAPIRQLRSGAAGADVTDGNGCQRRSGFDAEASDISPRSERSLAPPTPYLHSAERFPAFQLSLVIASETIALNQRLGMDGAGASDIYFRLMRIR